MNKQDLDKIEVEASASIHKSSSIKELEDIRIKYLGKKGIITDFFKKLSSLSHEEKRSIGGEINSLKQSVSSLIQDAKDKISLKDKQEKLQKDKIDITLPGRNVAVGATHPITLVINDITRIFEKMGFTVEEGPEIEKEYYNFDALNIPDNHPARDEQDSFYIGGEVLLRTQTSGVQIRTMENKKPPLAIISPGRCFRNDTVDATHSPIFHQIEGLVVDKNVSFSDLKGVLALFAKEMFGADSQVRFRPDFFPFTEPSAEVAFTCIKCGGAGCRVCKGSGWIEVAGCGMVDPEVFKYVGIDYQEYKGYAFGMGIERIAMIKYGIPDIRLLYENDMQFLGQFK